jgi:hypothetical protein
MLTKALRYLHQLTRRSRRTVERRASPRHPARSPLAVLGWHLEGSLAFHRVVIADASRTGLRFLAAAAPPNGHPVRVRFADRTRTWVEATLVGVQELADGLILARVAFLEPCPVEVLASVVGRRRATRRRP